MTKNATKNNPINIIEGCAWSPEFAETFGRFSFLTTLCKPDQLDFIALHFTKQAAVLRQGRLEPGHIAKMTTHQLRKQLGEKIKDEE